MISWWIIPILASMLLFVAVLWCRYSDSTNPYNGPMAILVSMFGMFVVAVITLVCFICKMAQEAMHWIPS